jgi:hypothetical protein
MEPEHGLHRHLDRCREIVEARDVLQLVGHDRVEL